MHTEQIYQPDCRTRKKINKKEKSGPSFYFQIRRSELAGWGKGRGGGDHQEEGENKSFYFLIAPTSCSASRFPEIQE